MHLRPAPIAAAAAGLCLLAGGIAYAAIPDANGRINACYKHDGKLRLVDTEAGGTCNHDETAIAWDQNGARVTSVERLAGPASEPAVTLPGTVVVAATLPPGFYDVRAHTTISTPPNVGSSCELTFRAPAASSEIEVDFSDEANVGGAQSIAKHSLEGVWQFGDTAVTVRLRCAAAGTWSARQSALVISRVTSARIVGVTSGDPVSL